MVDHISGDEYYEALNALDAPTLLSGKTTAVMHYVDKFFEPKSSGCLSGEAVLKMVDSEA